MHILSTVSAWINDWKVNESGIGPYHDMDTISMLLTGWVIFIFISVALVKYLYYRFVKKTGFGEFGDETKAISENSQTTQNELSTTTIVETISGVKSVVKKSQPQVPVRRRRVDKGAGSFAESFDEIAAVNASGACTGPDPKVVDFINQSHDWALDSQKRSWEDIRDSFINSVNKTLRDEDLKNDLAISVVDFKLRDEVKLSNIFAECIHPNNVKVTSDCELQVNGEVSISTKESGLKRCQFFVDRLCGRLSTLLDCEEKSAIVKLDGWPEICVGVSCTSPFKINLDSQLTEAIGDRITSAIRNSVVEVDYSSFDDFPVAQKFSPKKHVPHPDDDRKKYLLVKVVRGKELGVQKGCQEPYCAIELDDPPQKFQTDHVHSTDPVWNENFVFNVLPAGGELLFEIFDRVGTRFLGCTIISIDEIGNEKTRNLPLKSRRMEISDQISGSLEVQFTLLGEKEYLQRSSEIAGKLASNGGIRTTRTVFTRSPDSKSSTFAENVIKELERNSLPNANKSTLIIHAVQRDASPSYSPSRKIVKIEKLSDGSYNEVYDDSSLPRKDKLRQNEVSTGIEGQYGDERGRRKTRKGDIFTSIRRRLSKGRSQSAVSASGGGAGVENENVATEKDDMFQRSISADRQSMISARLGLGSARSSTSELSGISGFSTSTFVHENSTLVIECVENRVRKYYLVPPNLAESGKWKKKGKKLHIYNDHSFVAKHLPSGTMCEICTLRLPFSLGKQGYQCRDCKMRCHKECHIRAPSFCPKTTIYDIELSTAKRVEDKSTSNIFASLFGGKKDNSVDATNKNGVNETDATNNPIKSDTKPTKKKTNIFRKVTRLGKISEENLESKERLNGETNTTEENDLKKETSAEPPEKTNSEDTEVQDNSKVSPKKQETSGESHTEIVQAETHVSSNAEESKDSK